MEVYREVFDSEGKQIAGIDSEILDVTLTLDQTGIYEVGDFSADQLEETGDWMTAFQEKEKDEYRLFHYNVFIQR